MSTARVRQAEEGPDAALTVTCLRRRIGALIGPRGATIREIQEATGTRIDVEQEDGRETATVRIRQRRRSAPTGKEGIQITDGMRAASDRVRAIVLVPDRKNVGSSPLCEITCPRHRIGKLIGPRGATIRQIQQDTGTCIDIQQDAADVAVITIREATIREATDVAQVAAAEARVRALVHPPSAEITCVETDRIGTLIGLRGATIRKLQQDTGTRVDVVENKVRITGPSAAAVTDARAKVLSLLRPPRVVLRCGPQRLGQLIGPGGRRIRRLQELTSTRIEIDDREEQEASKFDRRCAGIHGATVTITGNSEDDVEAARERVQRILAPFREDVPCPKDLAGALIGDGGVHINDMRDHFAEVAADSVAKRGARKGQGPGDEMMVPFVEIEMLGVWHDDDERTVTVCVVCNDLAVTKACAEIVRHEVAAAVRGADYEGPKGRALRDEANSWAIQRSRLLEESHRAYENGDRGDARRLADEAQEAGKQMAALNLEARDAIYKHRNGAADENFLDLHGLYVQEALFYLGVRLKDLTARGRLRRGGVEDDVDFESPVLECVTGAGHHSPLGISRIKASVHELVDSLGLRCEVKNAGSFLIYC